MTLDSTIAAMYASMCFEPGEQPDWRAHGELFAPAARLVRVTDDGVFEFDPETFRRDLQRMIASGTLTSFWEGELRRETREFGGIAHVLSWYATRSSRHGEVTGRAIKSIQLFQQNDRWRISAMIWRRESATFTLGDDP